MEKSFLVRKRSRLVYCSEWVGVFSNCFIPQERFADLLVLQGVSVPAYADFHSADLNGNGVLMFEEWQQWV